MSEFHYAKIAFCLDLTSSKSEAIPVAILAEWFDGAFWKIALVGSHRMREEDFERLDEFSKTFLDSPFEILQLMIDHYVKTNGWHQKQHNLGIILDKIFSQQSSLFSEFLFESSIGEDEDPDETFDELSESVPGKLKRSFWHRINPDQLTSIDKTNVIES